MARGKLYKMKESEILRCLHDLKEMLEDWTAGSVAEMSSLSSLPTTLTMELLHAKIIISKRIGRQFQYKWDSIRPNVHMVSRLIESSRERQRKYNNTYREKHTVAPEDLQKSNAQSETRNAKSTETPASKKDTALASFQGVITTHRSGGFTYIGIANEAVTSAPEILSNQSLVKAILKISNN